MLPVRRKISPSRNLKEYKRANLSSKDFLQFFEMKDLEFLISREMNICQFSKLWDKKNLEKFQSLVLTQWIQDIFDIFFIQSKMECISCEIATTLLFTNSQVRHQKWFGPVVQGTSTGSRSSRSVNFSKELRKAFQWIKIKKRTWAFV